MGSIYIGSIFKTFYRYSIDILQVFYRYAKNSISNVQFPIFDKSFYIMAKSIPPCPDPERYVWVNRKSGGYWKLKRGSIKPAILNESFKRNSFAFKTTSPVARRMKERLEEFTRGLNISSLHSRLNGELVKTNKAKGTVDFSKLKGFEIQQGHPLENILLAQYRVQQNNNTITIQIPVSAEVVKQHNRLVTDFYFEGILLHGDGLTDGSLAVEYTVSKPYSFIDTLTEACELVLQLPGDNEPWMLLLKVSCLEGNELAAHAKHYGMRVVAVG